MVKGPNAKNIGAPKIVLSLEVHDPNIGSAIVKDSLLAVSNYSRKKARAFWLAFAGLEGEAAAAVEGLEIENPAELVGGEILVCLGKRVLTEKDAFKAESVGRTITEVTDPWYASIDKRRQLVAG